MASLCLCQCRTDALLGPGSSRQVLSRRQAASCRQLRLSNGPRVGKQLATQAAGPDAIEVIEVVARPPPTKPGVSFFDAMRFNGPAPELVNGRLAMLGFLLATKGEVETGLTVLQQVQQASLWQYALAALWVYASMVPILKGARHEAFGFFSPRAEITNGRAAMLGFGILLALEYKAGVPFF